VSSAAERLAQLARTLLSATQAGTVRWQKTDREDAFAFQGSAASVIVQTRDRDGTMPYELVLLDASGSTVESIVSHYRLDPEHSYQSEAWSSDLRSLWQEARVQALHIDELVDGIIGNIEKDLEGSGPGTSDS